MAARLPFMLDLLLKIATRRTSVIKRGRGDRRAEQGARVEPLKVSPIGGGFLIMF